MPGAVATCSTVLSAIQTITATTSDTQIATSQLAAGEWRRCEIASTSGRKSTNFARATPPPLAIASTTREERCSAGRLRREGVRALVRADWLISGRSLRA